MSNPLLDQNKLTVVDVGASGGMHKRWLNLRPYIQSILFEPDPEEFKKLNSRKADSSLIINSALSDTNREVLFNVCKWQEVSSIYEPNYNLLKRYHDADRFKIEKSISMKANSLNNLLEKEMFKEIDYMKIDTQGSELEILKGSTNFLDGIIGLEVEVEFVEIYKGQPLFPEVNEFIQSHGFSLIDMKRTFWKRRVRDAGDGKGQIIFADVLYFKQPEQVLKLIGLNKEKIIRSIYIYLVYGYIDLAVELLALSTEKNILSRDLANQLSSLIDSYERINVVPNFRGKGRIKNFFNLLGGFFNNSSFSSGSDTKLGN